MKRLSKISFDWDAGNRDKNKVKHDVSLEECEQIFYDHSLLVVEDIHHSANEHRYKAFGKTIRGRSLAIAFTLRDRKVRVISARDQSKKERSKEGKQ